MCSLRVNYRKSSILHFIVSLNNAFRILHNLPERRSAAFKFANASIDSCDICVRKCTFSVTTRSCTSTNVITRSTHESDINAVSALQQRWTKVLDTSIYLCIIHRYCLCSFITLLLWAECILYFQLATSRIRQNMEIQRIVAGHSGNYDRDC